MCVHSLFRPAAVSALFASIMSGARLLRLSQPSSASSAGTTPCLGRQGSRAGQHRGWMGHRDCWRAGQLHRHSISCRVGRKSKHRHTEGLQDRAAWQHGAMLTVRHGVRWQPGQQASHRVERCLVTQQAVQASCHTIHVPPTCCATHR